MANDKINNWLRYICWLIFKTRIEKILGRKLNKDEEIIAKDQFNHGLSVEKVAEHIKSNVQNKPSSKPKTNPP